ncbi:hypothetical protein SAMN05421752_11013 [Natronorubrum thiooxidans]|uniref:Uncharacterized protein n=1 Tax=Natronorubrum thiooxidans TaxID=308853 RepID=A0A1N7G5S6_9EURY|nr:hypothetical protein SAMN05421752_11013 [Natronorubrum thiooxidans]
MIPSMQEGSRNWDIYPIATENTLLHSTLTKENTEW